MEENIGVLQEEFVLSDFNIPYIRKYLSNIRSFYKDIPDPRDNRGKKYKLDYVLSLYTVCVLANHDSVRDARSFIMKNIDIFTAYFPELNTLGLPSEDCFCDCLAVVSKRFLEEAFEKFVGSYRDPNRDRLKIENLRKIEWEKLPGRHKRGEPRFKKKESLIRIKNHLAVDGKAKRGATDKKNDGPIPYIGGIFDTVEKQYVKQVDIQNGKDEGEATMIREGLSQMDLENTIITGDTLHSKKETLETIHKQHGEFLLRVKKDSHKVQYSLIKEMVEAAWEEDERNERLKQKALERKDESWEKPEVLSHTEKQEDYGDKYYEYDLTVVPVENPDFADYSPYISHVALLKTKIYTILRDEDGEYAGKELAKEYECAFFLSCGLSACDALEIIIAHWQIESSHWILDKYMNEDRSTGRKGNQIFNRAVILRICYNLLGLLENLVNMNLVLEETPPAEKSKKARDTITDKFTFLQSWPFIAIVLVLGHQEDIYSKMSAVYRQRSQACMKLQIQQKALPPEYYSI